MLERADDRVLQAFRRLQGDSDFQDLIAWLEASLRALDKRSRSTVDEAALRQQQGAAQVLAEIVERSQGKSVRAVPLRPGPPGMAA